MEVAVLGLGEAGGRLAGDLVVSGCSVRGWDPVARPAGVELATDGPAAVAGADVVLSVNAAAVALEVAEAVAGALEHDALYADLNTSSPSLKQELADRLPVAFADVALLGPVPALGLRTRPSPPATAPSGSRGSSGRSGCPSRSWGPARGTRPG